MMPFGFLGGAHFTSMSADPMALTTGGLSSLGGASAVLEYVWPPTPHPPTKPEVCLVMRASFSTKNTVKANECQVKKLLMKWCLISLLNTHLSYYISIIELFLIFTRAGEERIGSKVSF